MKRLFSRVVPSRGDQWQWRVSRISLDPVNPVSRRSANSSNWINPSNRRRGKQTKRTKHTVLSLRPHIQIIKKKKIMKEKGTMD